MPFYEYECQACSHRLESLQKISEQPLTDCPVCGKPALKKLISASGFRLKGSGWYATDFKNSGKKNVSGEAKGEGNKGGESKADAKPDTGAKSDKPAPPKPAAKTDD